MLSLFPRGVLDEILNLIESVSEDFLSNSFERMFESLDQIHFADAFEIVSVSSISRFKIM